MKKPQLHKEESKRLEVLKSLGILDTPNEERFDMLTREAGARLNVPISTISIIDENREWYKSHLGIKNTESPRETSFCGHAMLAQELFIVEDTLLDERFKDNPMVINPPFIRFYAGIALRDRTTGLPIGVFCIKDTKPRKMSLEEINILVGLAQRAEDEINSEPKRKNR